MSKYRRFNLIISCFLYFSLFILISHELVDLINSLFLAETFYTPIWKQRMPHFVRHPYVKDTVRLRRPAYYKKAALPSFGKAAFKPVFICAFPFLGAACIRAHFSLQIYC